MPDDPRRFLPVLSGHDAEPAAPAGPPIFERIAIVGVGAIGGSIALAARRAWPAALVIGVDRHEVLEQAMVRHAVDVASTDTMIISEADLVVLATPVAEIVRLLGELPAQLAGEALVTDVGSAKGPIVAAAAALPGHLTFIAGHPLACTGHTGFAQARSDLFTGRPWLLMPAATGERAARQHERLSSFLAGLGAIPVMLPSIEAHEQLVAPLAQVIASLEALQPGLATPETIRSLFEAARERRDETPPRP
jgi:prephenate dehydrogenase